MWCRCKTASKVGRAGGFSIDVRTACDTYPAAPLCRGGMYLNNDPLRSSILMSDNTKHLAKKCVKDAWPCLALRLAGTAVALLAVLGPFDVLRSASSLHVHGPCRRHDDRWRARFDLLGARPVWMEERGVSPKGWKGWNGWLSDRAECGLATYREVVIR